MKVLISDIEALGDSGKLEESLKEIIEILLVAVNDWPTNFNTLEDYVDELESFLGGASSKRNLEKKLQEVSILKNAWEAESISELLVIYEIYKEDVTIREIISEVVGKLS